MCVCVCVCEDEKRERDPTDNRVSQAAKCLVERRCRRPFFIRSALYYPGRLELPQCRVLVDFRRQIATLSMGFPIALQSVSNHLRRRLAPCFVPSRLNPNESGPRISMAPREPQPPQRQQYSPPAPCRQKPSQARKRSANILWHV